MIFYLLIYKILIKIFWYYILNIAYITNTLNSVYSDEQSFDIKISSYNNHIYVCNLSTILSIVYMV